VRKTFDAAATQVVFTHKLWVGRQREHTDTTKSDVQNNVRGWTRGSSNAGISGTFKRLQAGFETGQMSRDNRVELKKLIDIRQPQREQ